MQRHHQICTWEDSSNCAGCTLQGKLGCRLDPKEFRFFIYNQTPSLVMSLFGLVFIGLLLNTWWPLITYIAIAVAVWGLGIETRLLCSHCPYWAEDGNTLHCWALPGSPKLWRYRPEPMNKWEKSLITILLLFVMAFPVAVEGYGIWFIAARYADFGLYTLLGIIGITIASIMTTLLFYYVLTSHFCARCVNFSCPANSVPKQIVDAYLERNPVIREAWIKSGYRPD
jgi:hypothetical protein